MPFEIVMVLVFVVNYVLYLVFRARLVDTICKKFPIAFESLGRPNAFGESILIGIPCDRLCRLIPHGYPDLWKDGAVKKCIKWIKWIIYCQLANAILISTFFILFVFGRL